MNEDVKFVQERNIKLVNEGYKNPTEKGRENLIHFTWNEESSCLTYISQFT